MGKFSGLFRAGQESPREEHPLGSPEPAPAEEPGVSAEGYALLFVDDEESVLKALRRIFLDENYRILTASDAQSALQILAKESIQLVVSDHRMPGMTGAELLRQVKERWPTTIRIMLTGYADVQSIMGAVNEGAVYKFITKPWNDEDLRLTVSLALQQYALLQENKKLKEINRNQSEKIKTYASRVADSSGILGAILEKTQTLSRDVFTRAQKERQQGEFIIDTLVRLGYTTESGVVRALQKHLGLEYVDLRELGVAAEVVKFLPKELCEKSRILPIRLEGRRVTLAMADPSDILKCDNLALMTGFKVTPVIATGSEILKQLERIYGDQQAAGEVVRDDMIDFDPMDEIDIVIEEEDPDFNLQDLISSTGVPPIIRIVNSIISEAIRYGASDIHIEPKTKNTVVRYRIDGMLNTKIRIPADLHAATISRIKILAKLDIAERRIPQDGRISVKTGTRIVDLRVSTMPSINGEKVVMRILDKSNSVKRLEDLGLFGDDLKRVRSLIKKPQGMFISTGPTGSGKTTMLYSLLGEMLEKTKNFETIEDPVEYFLEDVNQIFVKERIGLSFATVLRATMRQDPDVILVGEVRDLETADVAFKAALTGHMVLTSLHTNNSVASITRLIDIGVKPYMIASALEGVIAQRLARKLCRHCRVLDLPNPAHLELLGLSRAGLPDQIYRPVGCPRCSQTGYSGRIGIYELFVMDDDLRHMVSENYRESKVVQIARGNGMKTLIEDGVEKVREGLTSFEELLRVIGPQIRHERSCGNCKTTIDAKFLFCPFCGSFRQDICGSCNAPQEEDWSTCPFCGTARQATPKERAHL